MEKVLSFLHLFATRKNLSRCFSSMVMVILLLTSGSLPAKDGKETVRIAGEGSFLIPVVIPEKSSPNLRKIADTFARYLGTIAGINFKVEVGDGGSGIVLGLPDQFSSLPFSVEFKEPPFTREEYLLRSKQNGLWLLGATELAVEHATWDILYRFGYRQFFPGKTWEIIPHLESLEISIDRFEHPDLLSRRIWYDWGTLDYNSQPYIEWCKRNRMAMGFKLNSGHAYGSIIRTNKSEFDAHPEYYALVGGKRNIHPQAKFCISNYDLRRLVVKHAVRQLKENPQLDSISLDPSDGGGWCECDNCNSIGSISDRVVILANEVAKAINNLGLGDKYVGMYAYNRHAPPPTIRVDPHVIISCTTAFITGGYTFDQIIERWRTKGATIGVYDYFSVIDWDYNMPGRAKASKPVSLAESIAKYYKQGARFLDCQSGDAWGPNGLGYYIAGRVMWNTDLATQVDKLTDDFLKLSFGPAEEPMKRFYTLLNFEKGLRPTTDLIARLYRCIDEARTLAKGKKDILNRIDSLLLYTKYVELFNEYSTGKGGPKAKERMLNFTWKTRKTMMIHTYGLWSVTIGQRRALDLNDPIKQDKSLNSLPEIENVGKYNDVIIRTKLDSILKNGISANKPVEMGFETVKFSENLVPAKSLKLQDVPTGTYPTHPQDQHTYYIWVDKAPFIINLKVTVQKAWNLRPHKIFLYSPKETSGKPVAESNIVRPDGHTYNVKLQTTYSGLHKITVIDGGDYTRIKWQEGLPVTIPSAINTPTVKSYFRGPWNLYFYVPKGAKIIGGWAGRIAQWAPPVSGILRAPDGDTVFDFTKNREGWFRVPVPTGQDGKLWKFEDSQGTRQLMTVPPYLICDENDLLLPEEVVNADRLH